VPFFQNLRNLLPEICHKRGILAIGGMTALFPNREDAELNTRALAVLEKDKKNEADCMMDGAWTGHPDQNTIAVAQFPSPNQTGKRQPDAQRYPELRPELNGVGRTTLQGTRAAIRTVIRYRNGYLNGKGASLLDGYMEDLATDRIYRLMIAQRLLHHTMVIDDEGQPIRHTRELVGKLFDKELNRILTELPTDTPPEIAAVYYRARQVGEQMILHEEFDPI
jgi:malate synthase